MDGRLLRGCSPPFGIRNVIVTSPSGKIIKGKHEGWESVITAKINEPEIGEYKIRA